MKTHLIMIGRTDEAWLKTGISVYVNRILRYIPFQLTVVSDVKNGKSLPLQVLKEKEGEALLKLFSPGDMVVLLDEKGKQKCESKQCVINMGCHCSPDEDRTE